MTQETVLSARSWALPVAEPLANASILANNAAARVETGKATRGKIASDFAAPNDDSNSS